MTELMADPTGIDEIIEAFAKVSRLRDNLANKG
jgi:hypothetical protein